MADFTRQLDFRGLRCPLPVLRAKQALDDMNSGETLRIVATDPASMKNIQAFIGITGNELVEAREEDGKFYYLIKKN
ncbi:MAG: SirA family protein [Candidatus Muproteobacteria bacterium RIFCSPHIGHO2_02_FULL_60_13]|uniref:SirA family protein n=1 Tax=Candidatus Muproteobacteria bacterium RIFCSPLOWO2_01_FULL_60_18 TaxID=1817768 RepID=A0A1F6TZD8_9PROT|nr:MAG: SirA family protein [Candidatus Muproteobacteria bacterium RIFCSPLOWO2_01_FULL_60_18]OGI51956.1 MAG: SirA family protein [Candidatus Muproteobacteria bacterium RIFCSPHIGHO2_01_60_12]OGI53765.1 MAG: SirA family protein [Candidatus Muproteobacteria bacterium RIFCSPHIGHO2_02_FULL_60_13]